MKHQVDLIVRYEPLPDAAAELRWKVGVLLLLELPEGKTSIVAVIE